MADLTPIRLLKPYRSFPSGDVLYATPALARRLVALGVAAQDLQGRAAVQRQSVERAVATGPVEVR